jgi:hypothetical protein
MFDQGKAQASLILVASGPDIVRGKAADRIEGAVAGTCGGRGIED